MAETSDNIQDYTAVFENLTILSTIDYGDKISWWENKFFIYKSDYYQGLRRWWNSETRTSSITKLEEFIDDVFKIIDEIISKEIPINNANSYYFRNKNKKTLSLKNETKEQIKTFLDALTKTISGIQNLKQTYENDLGICSSLDIIIEKINVKTRKFEESFLKSCN